METLVEKALKQRQKPDDSKPDFELTWGCSINDIYYPAGAYWIGKTKIKVLVKKTRNISYDKKVLFEGQVVCEPAIRQETYEVERVVTLDEKMAEILKSNDKQKIQAEKKVEEGKTATIEMDLSGNKKISVN